GRGVAVLSSVASSSKPDRQEGCGSRAHGPARKHFHPVSANTSDACVEREIRLTVGSSVGLSRRRLSYATCVPRTPGARARAHGLPAAPASLVWVARPID